MPSLGCVQLVVDFQRPQLAVDGVQEGVTSATSPPSIDRDDDDVVIGGQVVIPVQLPLVGDFLRPGTVVRLEESWVADDLGGQTGIWMGEFR